MNFIFIVSDTFRSDYLGCYGNKWVSTPNLDQLSKESVLFENCYVEGLPTIPERIVFFTGKFTLPWRGWQPLWDLNHDVEISRILAKGGLWGIQDLGGDYTNAMITDTYHFWGGVGAQGMNFHRGFHCFRWIRGQEFDHYETNPKRAIDPRTHFKPEWKVEEKKLSRPLSMLLQYAENSANRRSEEDYLPAKVMREGMKWLEGNCDDKFFLYIDCFDPHEPWDPPDSYNRMYTSPNYSGPRLIWAGLAHEICGGLGDEEVHEAKALYAAEVTLVDHWIGELLHKVERLGLMKDTLIVFTSDHGTCLNERGEVGKDPNGRSEVYRVPLLIRHPDGPRGKRSGQLVWTPDIMPTVLDILGVEPPKTVHGKTFWPLVAGEKETHRDYVVCGWRMFDSYYVRTREWSYAYEPGIAKNELYSLQDDPGETLDLVSKHPDKAKEMREKFLRFKDEASKLQP